MQKFCRRIDFFASFLKEGTLFMIPHTHTHTRGTQQRHTHAPWSSQIGGGTQPPNSLESSLATATATCSFP